MDNLPYEILLAIFEFLPNSSLLNCLLLSKQLYFPSAASILKKIVLNVEDFQVIKKLFLKPKKLYEDYRKYFKSFRLMEGNFASKLQLRQFLQPCIGLTELILDFPCLNDDDLWIITKACPLITLNLALDRSVSDEGIMTICKNSRSTLKHLLLKCLVTDSISGRGLAGIASSFEGSLLTFSLEFHPHSNNSFHSMTNFSPTVEALTPRSATSPVGFAEALSSIFATHVQLTTITLDWPINTNCIFKSIAENLRKLEVLRIGNTSTTLELLSILESNPNLKCISLFEIALISVGIKEIFSPLNAHSLTVLEIIGVCDFGTVAPIIPTFKNLKTIKFSPTTRFASISPAQVVSTDVIAANCPWLEKLALPIHSDDSLINFANNCPRLKCVDVQDGRAISNFGITILASKCKNLESLSLGFASFNDAGTEILAKFCGSRLRELHLPTPGKISSMGLITLAEKLPSLEVLLNLAPDFSMDTILLAISKLQNLRQLGFGIIRGRQDPFSKDQVDVLLKAGKRLRTIHFH